MDGSDARTGAPSAQPLLNHAAQSLNYATLAVTKQDSSDLAKRGMSMLIWHWARFQHQSIPVSSEDRTAWHLTCGYSWWQVLGSNQRRLSRRFYREHPLNA